MAAVVNAVVAHPKANSYITPVEAADHMSALDPSWHLVSETEVARLLMMTAAKINSIRFLGQPYFPTQGMAFPRKNDARVRSAPVTSLSLVATGAVVEEHTPQITSSGCEFTTEHFPIAATTNTVTCTIFGQSVVLADNGLGVLNGLGVEGTIDYTTGRIMLNTPVDVGTTARVAASWYANNKVVSTDLVFDTAAYLPDHLAGGSVHVPHSDGIRDYAAIIEHNIVTGVVTLDTRMSAADTAGAMLFPPNPRVLRDAQLVQLAAERGRLDWDRNIGRGIASVKIGDTARSYSNPSIPEKVKTLASKYRVHEVVFALLGPYTIYGKMGIIFGEWDVASTTATE